MDLLLTDFELWAVISKFAEIVPHRLLDNTAHCSIRKLCNGYSPPVLQRKEKTPQKLKHVHPHTLKTRSAVAQQRKPGKAGRSISTSILLGRVGSQ